jgi:hypothetical protein
MDLELYDCRHCSTFGVLPTSDGKCPHCRSDLNAEDKQGFHPPDWTPCPTRRSLEEERQGKTRQRVIVLCVIVPGIMALLASPAAHVAAVVAYGTRHEATSSAAMDSIIRVAGLLLLAGWLLVEGGLWALKLRWTAQIVLRVPLYLFIVSMTMWLALMHFVNKAPFFP